MALLASEALPISLSLCVCNAIKSNNSFGMPLNGKKLSSTGCGSSVAVGEVI